MPCNKYKKRAETTWHNSLLSLLESFTIWSNLDWVNWNSHTQHTHTHTHTHTRTYTVYVYTVRTLYNKWTWTHTHTDALCFPTHLMLLQGWLSKRLWTELARNESFLSCQSGRLEDNKEWAQATHVCMQPTLSIKCELHAITSMHECTRLECGDTWNTFTDKGPPTYHFQWQEGNRCGLAHGKRISSVSRKIYSWPALYGRHNSRSETMAVHTHLTTNVWQMHYDRVNNC